MMVDAPEPPKNYQLVQMISKPGVKRDGTTFEGNYYTNAQWTRWQRGRPRKMFGYKNISDQFTAPNRGCIGYSRQGIFYVHGGSAGNLEQQQFDISGGSNSVLDRTPTDLVPSDDNLWQFALMYDGGSNESRLIAHAAPNLTNIDNSTKGLIFYGDAYGNGQLTTIASSSVAGGIAVLFPYLFGFDIDGGVIWSVANTPGDFTGAGSGNARITGSKVVCGFQSRGGAGVSPAGVFFALDALIRVTFAGGAPVFDFDRVAEGYSILSSRGVVEHDGIYYWPGQDRWLSFNGVIQEIPNDMNQNDFFDNINFACRQKVWGTKSPRWGEIIWFWPRFPATECNWATILNVREKTWYDTPINRISGLYSNMFRYPIYFDDSENANGKGKLWMHEYGLDKVDGASVTAIQSFHETGDFSLTSMGVESGQSGEDRNIAVDRIEPDFITAGNNINISLIGRKYAQSDDVTPVVRECNDTTEKLDIRFQARAFRIKVESNVVGGDLQTGQPLMLMSKGDKRP